MIVLELYRRSLISSGKAATLLGVPRLDFIQRAGELGIPYFSFTGSRGSKLGDLGPYGKQVIQFYTQVKTITSRWFDDETTSPGIHTTISLK